MKSLNKPESFADQIFDIIGQDMTFDYSVTQMKQYFPERLETIKTRINELEENEYSKRRKR